jgi:hemolysin activation/secretion protein
MICKQKKTIIHFNLLFLIIFFCFAVPVQVKSDEPEKEDNMLSGMAAIKVKSFHLKGNTAFSDQKLSQITGPYENRQISIEELEAVRIKLTRHYTDRGYINSGAIIPDQNIEKGIITILIIEGKITDTKISGNDWVNTHYITSRLKSAIGNKKRPFNIKTLEESLKLIKQKKIIKNINANIKPGFKQGEAALSVAIEEARPYSFTLKYDNQASAGIGIYQSYASFTHDNLTGWGDSVSAEYKKTKGSGNIVFDYTLPVTRWDTSLFFNYSESGSTVISSPFDILDIKSRTETIGLGIKHPFYRTVAQEFIAGLKLEKKHTESFLLDVPFSFASHPDDFETELSSLNFFQEYVSKKMSYVFALKSDIKFGINWLGATVHNGKDRAGNEYADSKDTAWLLQMQWFKHLPFLNSKLLLKTNLQLSDDPLLSSEKFSIGGASSVRGYKENFIMADNGLVSSLEWRKPLFILQIPGISKTATDGTIELALFFDYGTSWNTGSNDPQIKEINSLGTGLRWSVSKNTYISIYYGHALKDIEKSNENNLQENGFHFEISIGIL